MNRSSAGPNGGRSAAMSFARNMNCSVPCCIAVSSIGLKRIRHVATANTVLAALSRVSVSTGLASPAIAFLLCLSVLRNEQPRRWVEYPRLLERSASPVREHRDEGRLGRALVAPGEPWFPSVAGAPLRRVDGGGAAAAERLAGFAATAPPSRGPVSAYGPGVPRCVGGRRGGTLTEGGGRLRATDVAGHRDAARPRSEGSTC